MSESSVRGLVLALAAASLACAPAPRMGEAVDIAEESAIIIWDAAAKTQHFIRRAAFRTEAKDFGFLVPTPTVPELKEADDAAFRLVEDITERHIARAKAEAPKSAPPAAAAAAKVEVVAVARVAGYEAAVLRANDAGALDGWLKANGYHSSPELLDWYKPYVEKSWIITAFKIDAGARARRIEGAAVRMTFKTEQPFFPYREPAAGKSASADRLLQIYYVGDARPEGRVGDSGAWPGRILWSDALQTSDRKRLFELLKLPEAASATRLTRFVDGSSPRPGRDDLFFSPAANQSVVPDPGDAHRMLKGEMAAQKEVERDGWMLFAAVAIAVAAGLYLMRRRRRG